MAAQIPDPRTFESWEDAFQYPIPAVSGMEKKLRTNIKDNHEKLRTLVGASYRDLLGTARTIVDADKQMHDTERVLVDLGRRSDSRILVKISNNQARLSQERRAIQTPQLALASQLSLLQKCLHAVHCLLTTRESPLLAAKLILTSRSLHRSLAKDGKHAILGGLGDRLAILRQRLLRLLERRFQKTGGSPSDLVADMTAFSLITSSSASDVVRHFQHLRLQTIKKEASSTAHSGDRLKAYLRTQQELRAVFPDLLSAALRTVAARPLLQDPLVLDLEELSLDVYLDWISSDVKNYTPYARYKDLQQPESVALLDIWTDNALESLLDNIRDDEAQVDSSETLMQMRKELIQAWLSSKKYKSRSSAREVLDQLRSLFMDRLETLLQMAFKAVTIDVTSTVKNGLEARNGTIAGPQSLWALCSSSMEFSNAALALRRSVVDRRHGELAAAASMTAMFDRGWQAIASIQSITKRMREIRWEDDLDDDDAEAVNDRVTDLLAKDDPAELQRVLHEEANRFMTDLEKGISSYDAEYILTCDGAGANGLQLLRALRELRQKLPNALQEVNPEAAQKLMCQDLVTQLHEMLTQQVVTTVEEDLSKPYLRSLQSSHRLAMLWDGTPPVPIQISPGCFRLLRALVKHMEGFGADIWSPDVVHGLLHNLNTGITKVIGDHIRQLNEDSTNKTGHVLTNGIHPESEQHEDASDIHQPSFELNVIGETTTMDGDAPRIHVTERSEDVNGATAGTLGESQIVASITPEVDHPAQSPGALTKEQCLQLLFDVLYMANAFPISQSAAAYGGAELTLQSLVIELVDKAEASEASVAKMSKGAHDYWRKTYLLFGLLCA